MSGKRELIRGAAIVLFLLPVPASKGQAAGQGSAGRDDERSVEEQRVEVDDGECNERAGGEEDVARGRRNAVERRLSGAFPRHILPSPKHHILSHCIRQGIYCTR